MILTDTLLHDLRHSLRALRRDAAFTAAAVLILALGIGANTAVFSIVNSVLLRPLAYHEPGRLFAVHEIVPQLSHLYPLLPVNARHFMEWKRRCSSFAGAALADGDEFNLTGAGDPERLTGARVTADFFSVLGVSARLGRAFLPEEGQAGRENVVVVTDSLWRRRFGASPALVGQTIRLNGVPHTVVGILPAGYRHHLQPTAGRSMLRNRVEIYKPWPIREENWGWAGEHNYAAVVRLRPGVTPEQAAAELNLVQSQIAARLGGEEKQDFRARLTPLQDQVVARGRSGLWLLFGAVGAVLLIACFNLGNLMLVRATGRSREIAIRAALGASRARIFRGVLTESLVVSLAGAALGVALAYALLGLFTAAAPADLPRVDEVALDLRALLFALSLSLVTVLLFGLAPAWRLTRADPQSALHSGGRSFTAAGGTLRLRELLVSAEMGLSVTLLIVAGLLITSFARLAAVDRGFDAHNVLTAQVSLPAARYPGADERRRFYTDLATHLEAQPGVSAAGIISVLPLQGDAWGDVVTVEGDTRPIAERPILSYRPITPHYLRAMGIPLLAGRTIEESDYPRKVALVSERAAQRIWPGRNPVGQRFRRGNPNQPPFEVIGVVGDVRGQGLQKDPAPMVYVALWERAPATVALALRTTSDPSAAAGVLRQAVWSLDSQLPVSEVQTMTQIEAGSVAQRRFQTLLIAAFGAAALLLAALGAYSVLAYSVTRRTSEIGVRMALGARPRDVLALVFRQGLAPVAIGIAAGVGGALALGRVLASLLFSVRPTDAMTYGVASGLTLAVAVCACWIPARRAARVDPVVALRSE